MMMMEVLNVGMLIVNNASHILLVTLFHAVLLDSFSHFRIVVAWLLHTLIPVTISNFSEEFMIPVYALQGFPKLVIFIRNG